MGNVLADTLKGRSWEGATNEVQKGMRLHQHIDRFTDMHPIVSEAKSILAPKGHLRSVAIDLLYDHFLSVHWARFSPKSRERFITHFYTRAIKASGGYPERAKSVVTRIVENDYFGGYAYWEGLKRSFYKIENRLSERARAKEGMMIHLHRIERHKAELEEGFLDFFPELMVFVRNRCEDTRFDHFSDFVST